MYEMEIDLFPPLFMATWTTDRWPQHIHTHFGLAVPARFVEHLTSSDVETPEDSDVSLRCVASGLPLPEIKWRREDGQTINIQGEKGREKGLLSFTLTSYPSSRFLSRFIFSSPSSNSCDVIPQLHLSQGSS